MNRIVISLVCAALLLSACGGGGGDSSEGFDAITVTKDSTPKVTVPEGFSTPTTETKVIEDGGGDTVKTGDTIKVNYLAVNGRTGKQFDSSFAGGQPAAFTLTDARLLPGFLKSLVDQKIGSRVLAAIAPEDGFGEARQELDLQADDTMVVVFDLVSSVPNEANGDAKQLPTDVPKVISDDDGHPAGFKKTDDTLENPTTQSLSVVTQGDGPTIESGQTVVTQYVGQIYPDGKVFDSSWVNGAPLPVSMTEGAAIACFTEQLVGQKVGSRVVLVCPPDKAYADGSREPTIKADDTLVFAVDLLDAS